MKRFSEIQALLRAKKDVILTVAAILIKLGIGIGLWILFSQNLESGNWGVSPSEGYLPPSTPSRVSLLLFAATLIWVLAPLLIRRFPAPARSIRAVVLVVSPMALLLITELSWNPYFFDMEFFNSLINLGVFAFLELVFFGLMGRFGMVILYYLAWIAGTANYFVLEFRSQPIIATDLLSAKTASNVASAYEYHLTSGGVLAFLLAYLMMVLVLIPVPRNPHQTHARKKLVLSHAVCVLLGAVGLGGWIATSDFSTKYHLSVDFWHQTSTYHEAGFVPAFITYLQKMRVEKPEGYSLEAVNSLLEDYQPEETQLTPIAAAAPMQTESVSDEEIASKKPTIIAIMNETFSDLSVVGPLTCTQDHLAFFHSLKDDPQTLEYGWNYVSTLGGGTSTTEFEFLTGNSISNTNGINPYADFQFSNVPNLARQLKNQGYHTIALHPETASNWRRSSVYPAMGFDEFLSTSYGDFADAERYVFDRVSDQGDYEELIRVYEKQDGPSFLFNVTLQNHGGYDINAVPEGDRVAVDEQYAMYTDFQAYQSLIHRSDQALQYLIDYFRNVDKPVILCFFGDHQPWLNEIFEWTLRDAGKTENDNDVTVSERYYTVPYLIWSNYEIDEDFSLENESGQDIMSTNYLGTQVLRYAGLPLSSYDNYRIAQREEIPVLNVIGCRTRDGGWYYLDEGNPVFDWLENYEMIQYNALFDKKKAEGF